MAQESEFARKYTDMHVAYYYTLETSKLSKSKLLTDT
jgi:hypothetical protein